MIRYCQSSEYRYDEPVATDDLFCSTCSYGFNISPDLDYFAENNEFIRIRNDRFELLVFRVKLDTVFLDPKSFDRGLIADEGDDDVTGFGDGLLADDGDVAGQDARVFHTVALYDEREELAR